jgi:tetratricopeptide (TPR) repeat protein
MILDNFEQVARHAEETLGRWLNHAGDARFLVTTREVLDLPGEEILALAPLGPAAAAALFTSRAEAARADFAQSADDQAAIAPLVKLLEGLPLAIELAAARVRVMRPRTLLLRMSERFKLLSSTGGRVDRQATLRAVFDWSWDLLTLPEKAAFAQLSVFEGGFTLDSMEATLDLSAYEDAPWPIDVLQSLLQKSLVRQVTYDRFDLLVSAQEYAAEHLRTHARYAGSGPAALVAAEVRHGLYFSGLTEQAAVSDACAELDNLVAACRRAAARGDADVAAKALRGAWAGLNMRGPYRVGSELASLVRAALPPGAAESAEVDWVAGRALMAEGKYHEANVQFDASLARAHDVGDRRCECRALFGLGTGDFRTGRTESASLHLAAALVIAREVNDSGTQTDAHIGLGNLDVVLGRMAEAQVHFETALALAQQGGDRQREGHVLNNLGSLYADTGRLDMARSNVQAALVAAREVGDARLEAIALSSLGFVNRIQGRFEEAVGHLETALAIGRDMGHAHLEWFVLLNLGMVCDSLARFDEALKHVEASLAVARALGDQRSEGQSLGALGLLHARQARLDEARHRLDAAEVLLRAVSDTLGIGLLLCSRAETEHRAGIPAAANAALAEAEVIAVEVGAGPDSELRRALARVRSLLAHDQDSESVAG